MNVDERRLPKHVLLLVHRQCRADSSSFFATDEDPLADRDSGMKEFERLLLSQLIVAQPNNYTEALQRPVPAAPRTIRRAVEILEHHADELLTVEDVASATGKYYGTTPMGYLREVRMKAVRAWLLEADPSMKVGCP